MLNTVALVQGASRGIGLQYCKTLLSRSPNSVVIATCRSPDTASDLQALRSSHDDRLHICQVDVWEEKHIENAAAFVKDKMGRLDMLINCAGMLHPSGKGETSLRDISFQGMQETFATNTYGPLLMAKHFGPLLAKGNGSVGTQSGEAKTRHAAVLANMSAKVGSITDNALGGWYSYRMAKAALNMATKNLSIELGRGRNRVICVSLHPGTVDTALSRPYHKNVPKLFTTEQSVDQLLEVIDSLGVKDTGKFFAYDRTQLSF